ncbi:hypothetical protein EJ06DRAFT_563583 [Trichodelitschia bisporula]|uniref:Amino acid transporter transmembrane domain-containing protein n=1 Tax=Trichodelitschia bisporula TaxID=703511 RepID=A0A6G1HTK8_9PEZI|nr:hypothetical protein EJ06DRAFT_563583 [Trichodelitschia bisporula]
MADNTTPTSSPAPNDVRYSESSTSEHDDKLLKAGNPPCEVITLPASETSSLEPDLKHFEATIPSCEVASLPSVDSGNTLVPLRSSQELSWKDIPLDAPDEKLVGDKPPPTAPGLGRYQNMEWRHCGLLPVPNSNSSIILIITLGLIAGYTGLVYGDFKVAHPEVTNMSDAGFILGGVWGREILGMAQILALITIMAAHVTTFRLILSTLSNSALCSIVFSACGVVVCALLTAPRSSKHISYFSVASCLSILTTVLFIMSVVAKRPAPVLGTALTTKPGLAEAMTAVLNIILSYTGHSTYFGFADELRDPRDFKKAVLMLQSTAITIYVIAAVVIYHFAGPGVPAPALSATTPILKKVASGLALPTVIIGGAVNGHVVCKMMHSRLWGVTKAGAKVADEQSKRATLSWAAIVFGSWVIAWAIAEAVPSFELILAFVSALFGGWFSYGFSGCLWLSLNRGTLLVPRRRFTLQGPARRIALAAFNSAMILLGLVICILGMWASMKRISHGAAGKPFSCKAPPAS